MAEPSANEEKIYHFSVSAESFFVVEQMDNDEVHRYVFSYTITIVNTGNVAAQLISRHWVIKEGGQVVQEVKGLGVVGEQPLLKPGEQFQYTSGTVLSSPDGLMYGKYFMTAEDGTQFEAEIPEFSLIMPRVLH